MSNIFTNLNGFQNAVKNAAPGSTIELKPGVYDGNISLDYRKAGKITVHMHGVTINGDPENKLEKYALGILGENIDLLCDEIKLQSGNSGVLGVLGHNIRIESDLKGYITGHNRGCLLMGTNHFIKGLNFDGLGNVGISGKGFPVKDNLNRTYSQDFGWFPSHNWRISQCVFQNIQPIESGDAGGGVRLIPHVKDVIVDNCLFRNIKGSGLWGDHNQKGFQWYYNIFEDIDTAEAFGKAMFLEIMDPDPNDKTGFVAKIAGNIFRRCDTQTILIAASSGQNPGGIDVFGNVIEGGWGLVAGAMPRSFKRKWDFRDQSTHESVEAKLENIRFRKNVIKPTTGPNHISIYQGKNSGLIEIDNNYYVTGHEYNWTKTNGQIEKGFIDSPKIFASDVNAGSLFIHGKSNAAHRDQNAIVGPMPDVFPFPEIFDEIPVYKYNIDINGLPVIDGNTPDPDPVVTDPVPDTGPKPVWIFSDYSLKDIAGQYETDADDACSLAAALIGNKKFGYEIKGITVGCYPNPKDDNKLYDYLFPDDQFHANHMEDYKGADAESIDLLLAYTHRQKFKNYTEESPNYIDLSEYSKDNPLYLLNFGILTEIAAFLKSLPPEDLQKVLVISHFTFGADHNNRRKDEEAYQFVKNSGVRFIELDKAGLLIDDKTLPKIDEAVLNTHLGQYFGEKWNNAKPDFSDFACCVTFCKEMGFGPDWIAGAKTDGSSNLQYFTDAWIDKQTVYTLIENELKGSSIPDPTPDPVNKDREFLISIRDQINKYLGK